MKTGQYAGSPLTEPRSHPWVSALSGPECQYYDLTSNPERIRTSLEDFRPYSSYSAIDDFYALLTGLNQPESLLESNDCAFTGPEVNENPSFQKELECSGRVMVLFRDLVRNTHPGQVEQLAAGLHQQLARLDPELLWGVVGTTLVPVRYLALSTSGCEALGQQVMISFWAWGDTDVETMANLGRVFGNLSQALRAISTQMLT